MLKEQSPIHLVSKDEERHPKTSTALGEKWGPSLSLLKRTHGHALITSRPVKFESNKFILGILPIDLDHLTKE